MVEPRRIALSIDLGNLGFEGAVSNSRILAPHATQADEDQLSLVFDARELQDETRLDKAIVLIACIPGAGDRLAEQLETAGWRLTDGLEIELVVKRNPEAARVPPNHEGATQRLERLR
jgi:hypothetical protein